MRTSVLLIAYHGDAWLPACITSLAAASRRRLHLVLVDNSGNTGIEDLDLSAFDAEVLATPRPMGFAEANNYALAHARHLEDTVLFLNQDTVSPAGWIDRCLAALAAVPTLGAVSPLIRTYDGTGWDPSFLACVPGSVTLPPPETSDVEGGVFEADHAPAPALLVRTDVLRAVGPFDPVYGSYYEDYDLCLRIRRTGARIGFCRDATIHHYSGSTTTTPERERKRMRQIIRNRTLYHLRASGRPRGPQVARQFLVDLPRRLLRGLLGTPSSQPPGVVLQAAADLVRLAPRLASEAKDRAAWEAYLAALGWPDRVPAFAPATDLESV